MHTLGINGRDGSKGVAAFWIYGVIEYAALNILGTYKSWLLKLGCDDDDMNIIKDNLQSWGVLGPDWRYDSEDKYMRFGCGKAHVKDFIEIIDDEDERGWMEGFCDREIFLFTYNGIGDVNPNPGYDPDEFRNGRNVAVEFTTHAINFRTKKNLGGTFKYNFRMQSLYLIDNEKSLVSTPICRKRGPDEWLVSPPQTRTMNIYVNSLDWSVSKSKQYTIPHFPATYGATI